MNSEDTFVDAATRARSHAYAPYSGYAVGAAVEDDQGRIWTGANVENVSYGAAICAERSAVAAMASNGGRQVNRVAVVTEDGGTPCGICLQTLLEFAPNPRDVVVVTVAASTGERRIYRLSDLFPNGFHSSAVPRTK